MDQNDLLLESETSNKSNNYFLFIKKTLQFLLPLSLLSFLHTYTYGFSLFFIYNFHFSTLVFPLFSHALERKYMFLICNGILAFLARTLTFNYSPPTHNFINEDNIQPTTETSTIEEVVPSEQTRDVALEEEEKEREEEEEEEEGEKGKFRGGSNSLIIERGEEDLYSEDEEGIDDEIEESVDFLGGSVGEVINLNTEELNHKFEEFIRKMKEEIRIEAQQQLLVA